ERLRGHGDRRVDLGGGGERHGGGDRTGRGVEHVAVAVRTAGAPGTADPVGDGRGGHGYRCPVSGDPDGPRVMGPTDEAGTAGSEEPCGELATPGAGGVGIVDQLEQVDELLTGVVVVLDLREQRVESGVEVAG